MKVYLPWRRLNREQRGQTILVFALMFSALLGFTALVTDAGIVYWNRRMLQNAADAAALAGAEKLPGDPNGAVQGAVSYIQANGVSPGEVICVQGYSYPAGTVPCQAGTDSTFGLQVTQTYSANDTLVVSVRRQVNFGLRYLIGAGDTPVVASAVAIVSAQNPGAIAPFAVSIQQLSTTSSAGGTPTPCTAAYVECSLKVGAQSSSSGNFQYIAWDKATPGAGACPGGGNTCVEYSLSNGYPGPIATPVTVVPGPNGTPVPQWNWDVPTQTGNIAAVKTAITAIAAWDAAKECDGGTSSCPFVTPEATLTSSGVNFYPSATNNGLVCYEFVDCPRIVVVPFISQTWAAANGQTMVTIVNFGCFYITQTHGNGGQMEIDGMFIPTCKSLTGQAWYGLPLTPGGILGNDIGVYLWR